jgi:hypothetical protein
LSSWGDPDGDAATGRAVSPPFAVVGDTITLRVGGGRAPGQAGVRLWVDGHVARSAVGGRSEVLLEREWDTRSLRGRTARVEVFDDTRAGWGHVMLDRVVQWRVVADAGRREPAPEGRFQAEPASTRRTAEARGLPAIP